MKGPLQARATTPDQALRNHDVAHEDPKFIRQAQICRRLDVSVRTWRRWLASRQAPLPVPNVPGRPRWLLRDIENFEQGLTGRTGRHFFGSARRVG